MKGFKGGRNVIKGFQIKLAGLIEALKAKNDKKKIIKIIKIKALTMTRTKECSS